MSYLQWTKPPELTTAATNLVIVAISIVCLARIIRTRKAGDLRRLFWSLLFAVMIPTGLYGFAVHAFVLGPETKRIAWIFLSVLLGLTTASLAIALLYELFGRAHLKAILIFNGAAEILFAVLICSLSKKVPNIHFIFIAYTALVIGAILVLLIRRRKARPHFRWYIFAILAAVAAGLFEVVHDFTFSLLWEFDQGSACHLAIAAALCLFAVGCRRGDGAAFAAKAGSDL